MAKTSWSIEKLFVRFVNNSLGNKTKYGNYYILNQRDPNGKPYQLMMYKPSHFERPQVLLLKFDNHVIENSSCNNYYSPKNRSPVTSLAIVSCSMPTENPEVRVIESNVNTASFVIGELQFLIFNSALLTPKQEFLDQRFYKDDVKKLIVSISRTREGFKSFSEKTLANVPDDAMYIKPNLWVAPYSGDRHQIFSEKEIETIKYTPSHLGFLAGGGYISRRDYISSASATIDSLDKDGVKQSNNFKLEYAEFIEVSSKYKQIQTLIKNLPPNFDNREIIRIMLTDDDNFCMHFSGKNVVLPEGWYQLISVNFK